MTKSVAQLHKEIARLQKQADAIRQKEVAGVIGRMKLAIAEYGITAADLGLSAKAPRSAAKQAAKPVGRKGGKGRKGRGVAKYRDDAGNTWTGHGRRPQWFIDAIGSGKTPEQLAA